MFHLYPTQSRKVAWGLLLFFVACSGGCGVLSNPYEVTKKVRVPLKTGTPFTLIQGAFDEPSHNRKGDEYSWDFGVPLGTSVVAAQSGKVIGIWEPAEGSGCHPQYFHLGHYLRIRHADGTIAQYVHVKSKVKVGDIVEKGQWIAETAENGWLCKPHLHFGVYRDARHINAPDNETLPLYFEGIEDGVLKSRKQYETPAY